MRLQDVIIRDTRTNQPLAGLVSPGTLYFVTDELVTERSNGLLWESYGGGIGTIGATGATGAAGAQGIQGIQGINGIQGYFGIPGNDGEDGEQGFPGLSGSGGAGGSIGSDVLSVGQASAGSGLVNLSTLGTIDWFTLNNTAQIPRATTGMHSKAGGSLGINFDWIISTGTVFTTTNSVGATYTTAFPDDRQSSLSAVNTGTGIFSTAGARYGFTFGHIPASKLTRRLVIFASSYSCDTELTVKLNGQIITSSVVTYSGTVSVGRSEIFTIDYCAPQGGELTVIYNLKTVLGSNQGPNICFFYAYITTP